jgi:hypothetical protein
MAIKHVHTPKINVAKPIKLTSSSTVKGEKTTSTKSGTAGGGSTGALTYNVNLKMPKSGVRKRGDIWK